MKTNKKDERLARLDKVKALFDSLPWLKDYYNLNKLSKVTFIPLNREALETGCGFTMGYNGTVGYRPNRFERRIRFFSESGRQLGMVGVKNVARHPYSIWRFIHASGKKTIMCEETVVEALRRIKTESGLPAYVIGTFNDEGSGFRMIVSKVPQPDGTLQCSESWEERYAEELKTATQEAKSWVEGALKSPSVLQES